MQTYNFRSNTGNALKYLFGLCCSSKVVNILRIFASSVSNISAVLLFSVCAKNVAGIAKPTSFFSFANNFHFDRVSFVFSKK